MGRIIRLLREALQSCRNDCPEEEEHWDENAHVEAIYDEMKPVGIIVIFDGKNITENRAEYPSQVLAKWLT